MFEDIEKVLKENIHNLIELKIIKNEKGLENPTLDTLTKIAQQLNLCIKDLICYYCCDKHKESGVEKPKYCRNCKTNKSTD